LFKAPGRRRLNYASLINQLFREAKGIHIMKKNSMLVVCLAMATAAFAPLARAQKWEFGGGVGGGFYTSQDISGTSGSAAGKVGMGLAGSAWLASNGNGHWGGEIRYDYERGDLQLNGGGSSASFGSVSHAIHYDLLWYATPNGSRIRPFVAVGAGIKIFEGNGAEVAFQPLSNVALLTKAQDLTPMASAGAGVKIQLASRVSLRFELHDYLTPFPKKVITPNFGEKVGGWGLLQDFVPMVGISYTSEGR